MTLAILLTRRSHLKTLSPVIDASLRRGHDTLLVTPRAKAKKGDALRRDELERLWPKATIVDALSWWVDAVVALEGMMPEHRGRRVAVDPFYDCWLRPPRTDGVIQVYTSLWHASHHASLWKIHVPLYYKDDRDVLVGWLPSDQICRCLEVPHVCTHEYHPVWLSERDSAIFFALKLDVPEPWRHSRVGRHAYRRYAEQARNLAHAEGLRFVVKSRAKNGDPWWLRRLADEYVLDECMVPYTSLSLLARARWCVHFESGAAFEAALMGAYGIAIAVPQSHVVHLPGGSLNFGHAAWLDWPGVSQYGLPQHNAVPTMDAEARRRWVETFLGPCDGKVGERVVEIAGGDMNKENAGDIICRCCGEEIGSAYPANRLLRLCPKCTWSPHRPCR